MNNRRYNLAHRRGKGGFHSWALKRAHTVAITCGVSPDKIHNPIRRKRLRLVAHTGREVYSLKVERKGKRYPGGKISFKITDEKVQPRIIDLLKECKNMAMGMLIGSALSNDACARSLRPFLTIGLGDNHFDAGIKAHTANFGLLQDPPIFVQPAWPARPNSDFRALNLGVPYEEEKKPKYIIIDETDEYPVPPLPEIYKRTNRYMPNGMVIVQGNMPDGMDHITTNKGTTKLPAHGKSIFLNLLGEMIPIPPPHVVTLTPEQMPYHFSTIIRGWNNKTAAETMRDVVAAYNAYNGKEATPDNIRKVENLDSAWRDMHYLMRLDLPDHAGRITLKINKGKFKA